MKPGLHLELERARGQVLRVTTEEWGGAVKLHVRIWYTDIERGELRPSKEGVTVSSPEEIDRLIAALSAAKEHVRPASPRSRLEAKQERIRRGACEACGRRLKAGRCPSDRCSMSLLD